jgi:hypothetical protein
MRLRSDATLRNREPILGVLARHVRAGDTVLEIASGSGQHAVYLAPRLGVAWQPTDTDPEAIASVEAWRAAPLEEPDGAAGATGGAVLPVLRLDVRGHWPAVEADVLVCINMVHISPWGATLALLEGAARLAPRVIYLYGPYRRAGSMAPSNEAFDRSLRARDPRWGVRDVEAVVEAAAPFELVELVEMPANNLSVVLRAAGRS